MICEGNVRPLVFFILRAMYPLGQTDAEIESSFYLEVNIYQNKSIAGCDRSIALTI